MKLESVYLNELNTESRDYKVKVTVAEKGRPRESPKKPGLLYQTLILEDEKKNKMRCALFGEQIRAYDNILKPTGKYEISKAPISIVDEQYKFNIEELPYQMTIGQQTVVQRLNLEAGPIVPNYQPLSTIPRTAEPDHRFDVVVVVLYVEEQPRMIPNSQGRESPVREIVVTDTSHDQSITVSAWNDLAVNDCNALSNWADRFIVVGITALRAQSTARGFILSTTMSTRIIHDPEGDRAAVLREWARVYPQVLLDKQARVLTVRYPSDEKRIYTIADLRNRKPSNTMQEEIAWIQVTIPNAELSKIYAYAGCNECSKRTRLPVGAHFHCTSCKKRDTTSAHKVIFKFDAVDSTGAMSFTTFNDDTEKLFRKSAAEICSIKNTENLEAFAAIQEILSTRPFLVKVGPTKELSMNNVLIWTLKSVEVEDGTSQITAAASPSEIITDPIEPHSSEQQRKLQKEIMLEEIAHGKKPLVIELDKVSAGYKNPSTKNDAKLAELAQLHEMDLASQEFDADMFLMSEPPAEPLKIPELHTPPKEALPTWSQLSRKRSPPKSKETIVLAIQAENTTDDTPAKKKVKTALFQDMHEKETAAETDSPMNPLEKP